MHDRYVPGRTITIGRYEAELVRARTTQSDPAWRVDYRATRPKVEAKIGHLVRRCAAAGEPALRVSGSASGSIGAIGCWCWLMHQL